LNAIIQILINFITFLIAFFLVNLLGGHLEGNKLVAFLKNKDFLLNIIFSMVGAIGLFYFEKYLKFMIGKIRKDG